MSLLQGYDSLPSHNYVHAIGKRVGQIAVCRRIRPRTAHPLLETWMSCIPEFLKCKSMSTKTGTSLSIPSTSSWTKAVLHSVIALIEVDPFPPFVAGLRDLCSWYVCFGGKRLGAMPRLSAVYSRVTTDRYTRGEGIHDTSIRAVLAAVSALNFQSSVRGRKWIALSPESPDLVCSFCPNALVPSVHQRICMLTLCIYVCSYILNAQGYPQQLDYFQCSFSFLGELLTVDLIDRKTARTPPCFVCRGNLSAKFASTLRRC